MSVRKHASAYEDRSVRLYGCKKFQNGWTHIIIIIIIIIIINFDTGEFYLNSSKHYNVAWTQK
jgi:hypothetical protein